MMIGISWDSVRTMLHVVSVSLVDVSLFILDEQTDFMKLKQVNQPLTRLDMEQLETITDCNLHPQTREM